ncbi:hypothetical protein [Gracilibacillus xinjiangensis]|uniref:Uncharacterized protein n=1 Tax=Gracilibacillus xinjiangensis TaxID=1193282 RepID=A0ABV8WYK7_9BACI
MGIATAAVVIIMIAINFFDGGNGEEGVTNIFDAILGGVLKLFMFD